MADVKIVKTALTPALHRNQGPMAALKHQKMNVSLHSSFDGNHKSRLLKVEINRIKAVLTGLVLTSLLATLHIYLSNRRLYTKISAVLDENYLAIPNGRVIDSLVSIQSAILGSVFYVLSLGAVISLVCIALITIQTRFFKHKTIIFLPALCLQITAISYAFLKGPSLFPFLYFVLLPPIIYFAMIRFLRQGVAKNGWYRLISILLPIVILALSWVQVYNKDILINLRDNFLHSSQFGKKVNDFYYQYTLYSAETIKPLHKKTIKTCALKEISQNSLKQALALKLEGAGYQVVNSYDAADFIISGKTGRLVFSQHSQPVLESSINHFLNHPAEILIRFSSLTDPLVNFRKLLLLSLLLGFPLLFYFLGFCIVRLLTLLFLSDKKSYFATSFVGLMIGFWFFIPIFKAASVDITESTIRETINSKNREQRIEAYKTIHDNNIQLSNYNGYHKHLVGGTVPERYWIARALAKDQHPRTFYEIIQLLKDPNLNVVCQSLYAIGRRGNIENASLLLDFIQKTDHWYLQEYAYSALYELGWKNRSQ